jgi:hypothetical protein
MPGTELSPARQRSTILLCMMASGAGAAVIWWASYALLPPLAGMGVVLALQCVGAATLFALVPGIEAIAHERLLTRAIDPLAGADSARMRVNQRYLRNTLEQWALFAPGLLLLALYADGRATIAATLVWVLGRWAFWIGYHIAPRFRAIGLIGMAQSLLILLYCTGRFADEVAGRPGAVAVVALFLLMELLVTFIALRPAKG